MATHAPRYTGSTLVTRTTHRALLAHRARGALRTFRSGATARATGAQGTTDGFAWGATHTLGALLAAGTLDTSASHGAWGTLPTHFTRHTSSSRRARGTSRSTTGGTSLATRAGWAREACRTFSASGTGGTRATLGPVGA